jgi:hypothetical protein
MTIADMEPAISEESRSQDSHSVPTQAVTAGDDEYADHRSLGTPPASPIMPRDDNESRFPIMSMPSEAVEDDSALVREHPAVGPLRPEQLERRESLRTKLTQRISLREAIERNIIPEETPQLRTARLNAVSVALERHGRAPTLLI